jgi:adenosylmethionine-8-amino-7-oxononanoate aminotransferase
VIDLQQAAKDHLWLYFARTRVYRSSDAPIIVRGEGCHLEDTDGNRYLGALAGAKDD